MIYTSLVVSLILSSVLSQYTPEEIIGDLNSPWLDFLDCDHDKWEFANPDPGVHARHRDGFADATGGRCYYGAWSDSGSDVGGNSRANLWGEKQWIAVDIDSGGFMLTITIRLFAFCDYETSDSITVWLKDMWEDNGADEDLLTDDNWGRVREFTSVTKNRNNCVGWDTQMTDNTVSWLDEVDCTNNNEGTSCYTDVVGTMAITKGNDPNGNRFGLRIEADLNNGWANEAFAWSNIQFVINPTVDGDNPCCTGTRSDHPETKSCSAFGEQRNCENKGCEWSLEDQCQYDCCRKDDSGDRKSVV